MNQRGNVSRYHLLALFAKEIEKSSLNTLLLVSNVCHTQELKKETKFAEQTSAQLLKLSHGLVHALSVHQDRWQIPKEGNAL